MRRALGAAEKAARSRMGRKARRQVALKDVEIAALRRELALARGEAPESAAVSRSVPAFFVVGYQKSGTTWLMRMLDAHPEVLCKGEGRFFDAGWRQKSLRRKGVERPPSSLYHALLDAEYLRFWIQRSVWSHDEPAREHLDNLMRMAVDYFLQGELLKTGKRFAGDKSPLLTPETMKEISVIYPEARVIHIIRDGRDAAVSAAHHSWNFGNAAGRDTDRADPRKLREAGVSIFTEGQLEKLASDWNARVGRAAQDGPALLGENYTEVRYEDLIERPEEELARLLRLLGVDIGEENVKRCIETASFEKLAKGRERGEEDPSSFFRKGVAGDWKNVLTGEDRKIFKEEAGNLLVKLGYEREDDW